MSEDKVIDINSRRPHLSGEALCIHCKHKWMAVAPVGTTDLECPECSLLRGAYIGNILPENNTVFECNCGNEVFHIATEGLLCLHCGLLHTIEDIYTEK